MAAVDVLIPACGRKTGLAVVLTSLLGQTLRDCDVVVSDQTSDDAVYLESGVIQTLVRALRRRGHRVELHRHPPRRGLAEQRHFLLARGRAPYVHVLDDDVLREPLVLERMPRVIRRERRGFVGCAATGLGFLDDERPHQQRIEPWDGPVRAERFDDETIPWERQMVNNAANPLHLEARLSPAGETVRYKEAWIGGANVLYDQRQLRDAGRFGWWSRLPPEHAGEEAATQFMLLRYHDGCGILPSGTYHLDTPTTVTDRKHNATALFGELIAEYEAGRAASASQRPAVELTGAATDG